MQKHKDDENIENVRDWKKKHKAQEQVRQIKSSSFQRKCETGEKSDRAHSSIRIQNHLTIDILHKYIYCEDKKKPHS